MKVERIPVIKGTWVAPIGALLIVLANGVHGRGSFSDLSESRHPAFLPFALNYHLGGTETCGYHPFKIALHTLKGITLFGLVIVLFKGRPLKGYGGRGGHLGAAGERL